MPRRAWSKPNTSSWWSAIFRRRASSKSWPATRRSFALRPATPAPPANLLRVLGYRMRGGCGSDVVLETVNASRAFLTIDSGFPLAELEQALRAQPAVHAGLSPGPRSVSTTSTIGNPPRTRPQGEFIDFFLADPRCAACIWRFRSWIRKPRRSCASRLPAPRLKLYAHVLDFFGGMFEIRDGKAVVPGGARSEKAWAELAGAAPDKGAAFFERLLTHDDGWLASYYRCAGAHQRPGEGLSDRSGAAEALLRGDSRTRDQSRPGAAGVPLQYRHAAADHAAAPGRGRQAASSGRSGGLEEPVHQLSHAESTTPS